MPAATQLITSFLGGEISQYAQGRYDRQDYRTSMRTCLNGFPTESGAWTRRPGTRYAGHTKGGAPGREIKFDFEQATPVTMEFTDGAIRFRVGPTLISTNDAQTVVAVSAANPAVVEVASAVTWQTGDTLIFPGASTPLLENRQFTATLVDSTHFSFADALTGATIDGSTIGTLVAGTTVERVHEVATSYVGSMWQNLRVVQAETTAVILSRSLAPQALTVSTPPAEGVSPQFSIAAANFLDGPYFDPFTNGVQANPSGTSGVIPLTLSFPDYDATVSYPVGAFVTSSGINYKSLIDQNVNNTPASSPAAWTPTAAGAAINNGKGFLGTDIGRHVRFFSEPALWSKTTAYTTGAVVSYNPSGAPGAATYWQALGGNTGKPPGSDITNWQLVPNGAVWTWGKIVGFTNLIDPALAGSANIGSMTDAAGLAAAFDGNLSQDHNACAAQSLNVAGSRSTITINGFVGKNYSASPQIISSATIYPATDFGFAHGFVSGTATLNTLVATLRGSATAPSTPSSGTILGTTTLAGNTTSAIAIQSSDTTTAWNYVWFEITASWTDGGPFPPGVYDIFCCEVQFFKPISATASDVVSIEILGPPLLYTSPIRTWRLGLYSNTTGWPTCGCYHEGRIWLAGAVANRFDACVSNGITGSTINFAPTDQFGNVAASNAISAVLNSDSVNPIFWLMPDLQGVILGTQAGEWLVQAPTSGPIAPTNITARRVTKIGCSNIEPRRTDHTNVFVKRYGRKLMEYFADVFSGKFSAPNLADKAQHIPRTGMAELAYTEAINPIIWGRNSDGSMFGITYKRDTLMTSHGPTFYGWHRHALGSGRLVESICAGPSTGGDLDTLTMVTNDTATGVRHVELLTDMPDEDAELSECWFLDDAVNPTSVSISNTPIPGTAPYGGLTINGLWHLNGKTVQVFAGGLDCGDPGEGKADADFVVSNGSVFVPFGDSVAAGPGRGLFTADFANALSLSEIVVGFTYNSDGQAVRLVAQADTGARNGPALGAPSRTHRAALKLVNAKGLSIGGNFSRLYPCLFKAGPDSQRDLPVLSTFSGIFFDQLRDDFTYEDSLSWRVSRPFPATVTAAGINLRTEDM